MVKINVLGSLVWNGFWRIIDIMSFLCITFNYLIIQYLYMVSIVDAVYCSRLNHLRKMQ